MKPLKDRILALPIKQENKTTSGLIMNTEKQTLTAKVVEVGDEVKHIKVGDTILYNQNTGIPFDYNGERHIFLNEGFQVISIL